MPLPLSVRSCVCGRRLDLFGHHRAACSKAGVLSRRGFAVESVVEKICREAGENFHKRDDARRLEVAKGLSIFGGVQLALDARCPPIMGMGHL